MPSQGHHLLIGGTGRAGTSFLVRYLTAAGLDTTLARQGAHAFWDDHANAGLEEMPVTDDPGSFPYVIKTPWLHEIIEKFAADPRCRIDAVIVPVRSLREAAASRVIVELRNIYANAPWMTDLDDPFSNWGTTTAGGCLFPLEPIDQARLLATGFHQLIERLVQLDVPIIFLAFPRFAQDPDYLFQKLAQFFPGIEPAQARDLHARVADATKIRVGDELRSHHPLGPAPLDCAPDLKLLHNAALRRELTLSRFSLEAAKTEVEAARTAASVDKQAVMAAQEQMREAQAEVEAARTAASVDKQAVMAAQEQMREAQAEVAHRQARIAELERITAGLQREMDGLRETLTAATDEVSRARARADELAGRCAESVTLLTAIRASTSWRLTGPMRNAKVGFGKLRSIFVSRIAAGHQL